MYPFPSLYLRFCLPIFWSLSQSLPLAWLPCLFLAAGLSFRISLFRSHVSYCQAWSKCHMLIGSIWRQIFQYVLCVCVCVQCNSTILLETLINLLNIDRQMSIKKNEEQQKRYECRWALNSCKHQTHRNTLGHTFSMTHYKRIFISFNVKPMSIESV